MSRIAIVLLALFAAAGFSSGSEATEPYAGKTSADLDKVLAQASQSIQQNPNDPKAYYQRGVAERALGALETAAVRAEGADHSPSPAEMETYRSSKRHMDAAIADFDKAIALDPRYGDAYLQRGLAKMGLGNVTGTPFVDQARLDIHRALAVNPDNVDAIMVLGDLESDRSKAVEDYTRAITIQPNNSEAYAGRARFEEFLWHSDMALSDLAHATQLSPTETKYYLQRIAIEVMQATEGVTTWDAPMPDLNKEIALDPKDLGTLSYRAFGQERLGNWKEALSDYDKLLQLQPLEAVAQCRRGFVKQNLGDSDGALSDFNQAIRTEAGFYPSLYCRAAVEQSRGDLAAALADMRRGLGEEPEDAEYPNIHIWIVQSLQGNNAAADQELTAYLTRKPMMYLDDWIHQIANFFLGKISEEDFLKAAKVPDAKDRGKEWEGWYYAGCKRLVAGDRATADEYFLRCASMKKIDVSLIFVSSEMENLGKSTGGL